MSRRSESLTRLPTMTCFSSEGRLRRDLPTPLVVALFLKEFLVCVGVAVHELAHELVIVHYELEVWGKMYFNFRLDNIWGYIDIQTPRTFTESFLIFTAPFYVNTLLSVLLFSWLITEGITPWSLDGLGGGELLVVWLAVSISIKSIPSPEDVRYIGRYDGTGPYHELQALLVSPVVAVLRLLSRFPIYFLDVGYALVVWAGLSMLL